MLCMCYLSTEIISASWRLASAAFQVDSFLIGNGQRTERTGGESTGGGRQIETYYCSL